MKFVKKIKAVDYHRNGVAGCGFHVILFNGTQKADKNMMAVVFPSMDNDGYESTECNGYCAVLNTDLLKEGNITFGENSWRGDEYERELRKAIVEHEKAEVAETDRKLKEMETQEAEKLRRPKFYLCGICETFHRSDFHGDCRDDSERLNIEDLDEKYGFQGWEEIEMEDAE